MKQSLLDSNDIMGYISVLKDELKNHPDEWKVYGITNLQEKFKIPTYKCRNLVSILRSEPEVRYRFEAGRSRFKPKTFQFGTPEQKMQDLIDRNTRLFEFLPQEEIELVERLVKYYESNSELSSLSTSQKVKDLYILCQFCEKLKIKDMDIDWKTISSTEFSPQFYISELEVFNYIELLCRAKILKKNLLNNSYKLTISESAAQEVDKELAVAVSESNDPIQAPDENLDILTKDGSNNFLAIPELTDLNNIYRSMTAKSNELSNLLVKQLKLFNALQERDTKLNKERKTMQLLVADYNKYKSDAEQYEAENKQLKAGSKAARKRIDQMLYQMMGQIDEKFLEYANLPSGEKDGKPTINEYKARIDTIIADTIKSLQVLIKSDLTVKENSDAK